MRMERTIEQLIAELRDLRLRVAQLEAAATNDRVAQPGETAAANESEDSTSSGVATAIGFKKGDKVLIKNKLKRPATWPNDVVWNEKLAQRATVTHLYREQVHFVTDNGVKTWRAVNNLKLLNRQQE